MTARLKSAVLYCFACLALAFALAGPAGASSGRGGGGDSDDRDSNDGDSPDSDGGEGGGSDDGGESGGSDDGGESGGSDDGGESGSTDDGGEGGESGNGGRGEGGEGSVSGSGHSGRGVDDDDLVSVSRNDAGDDVREGEAIVLTSRGDFTARLAAKGFRLVESFRVVTIGASALRVAVPKGMSERAAFEALQALDPKSIVTFNHIYSPAAGAAQTAPIPRAAGAKSRVHAKVGLVDAGVDAKHPLLKQVAVTERSFDATAAALPDAHGTAVASLIAGAAPGATVFAANVFTLSSDGREIATADAIVRGLDWLASLKVAVINLSLTGPANPILEAMIGRLTKSGHVLVAAVGNEGPRGAPQFPAAYDRVVGVTAVDDSARVYLYANQGDYVDFAAPGVNLEVADHKGLIDKVSGTSYAAPFVAARLAVLINVPNVRDADAAIEALAARARDLGAPGRDPVYGHGLIAD